MTNVCDCKDFKKGMAKITSYIVFGVNHSMKEWDFKFFEYCPWCGIKLEKLDDDATKE